MSFEGKSDGERESNDSLWSGYIACVYVHTFIYLYKNRESFLHYSS